MELMEIWFKVCEMYHGICLGKPKPWQPLGPLLKVKLLVGYMRVSMCRVGTADLRRINCPKIATKYTWSQHWDCIKLRKQPNDNRQNNTTHFGHSADLKEFPEHGCTSDKWFVTPTSINYWRLVKELEYQRLSYLQETYCNTYQPHVAWGGLAGLWTLQL